MDRTSSGLNSAYLGKRLQGDCVYLLRSCSLVLLAGLTAPPVHACMVPVEGAGAPLDSSLFRRYAGLQSRIREARQLMNQRQFEASRHLLQVCFKAIPDHAEAHYLLAQMAYEERRFEEALAQAQWAERSLVALEQLHRTELAAAEARDAALDAALQSSLSNLDAAGVDPRGCSGSLFTTRQHALDDQRQKLGRFEEQADVPGVPAVLYLLQGNCLVRLKRSEAALACYQLALQKDPASPTAWNNVIGVFLGTGDLAQARDWASRATQANIALRPELKKALQDKANP
jgi:tetratricopeptide (TPR) repeat protein